MLLAAGHGVANLIDYTQYAHEPDIQYTQVQGTQEDTFQATLRDFTNTLSIIEEDDLLWIDETDGSGWPTVNLAKSPALVGTAGGGFPSPWYFAITTSTTGITYGLATPPVSTPGGACASISLSNAVNGADPVLRQDITLPQNEGGSPLVDLPYYLSFSLLTSSAPVNCGTLIQINWHTATGAYISTSATGLLSISSTQWTRLTLAATPPATAAIAKVYVKFTARAATNSGTLYVTQAQFERATFATYILATGQTALQANKYPTPFCDNGSLPQPGCRTDKQTGLYYRQLRVFGGLIRHLVYDWSNSVEGEITLTANDYGCIVGESPLTMIVSQQQDSAAIAAVCQYGVNQGFLAGLDFTTYVQSIDVISAHVYNWATAKDALDTISNQSVAAYWVDAYLCLHYAPALAQSTPFALSDQPDFVTTFPFSAFSIERDSTQSVTSQVVEGSTQLSSPQTYTATGDGATTSYSIHNGQGVAQIDSVSVGGSTLTVGLYSVNTFAQGYGALLDPSTGKVYMQTAPSSGASVVIVFRFEAPVLVKLHATSSEASTGAIRRKIHHHLKVPEVTSQQAAIDRANAELAQFQKARPIGHLTINTSDIPLARQHCRAGQAVQITHRGARISATLYQIVQIVYTLHNGILYLQCDLGFYRPNFVIMQAIAAHDTALVNTDAGSDTVLQDVLSVSDGWTMSDAVVRTQRSIGTWGSGTVATSSTWNGSLSWG